MPREKYYQSPTRETLSMMDSSSDTKSKKRHSGSTTSDQTEYRSRSADRHIRRTNSLLDAARERGGVDKSTASYRLARRSISLFDDEEDFLPLPRQVMTLGRKYKDTGKSNPCCSSWRDNFNAYRTDKIQEESIEDAACLQLHKDEALTSHLDSTADIASTSECTSLSICNSNTNLLDTTSSVSIRSHETSPMEYSSNALTDRNKSPYRTEASTNFESRLLAAENLIKESKLKNLGLSKFDPNLTTSYKDMDKCDKESLSTIAAESAGNSILSKRRSYIPSLRLRSGSLTRESSLANDRRKSFAGSQDTLCNNRSIISPEKSLLSKFFRGASSSSKDNEAKENKMQKPKQHKISRFLRPDFFDTPREESQYVKEKEAQKAAENERRKSRFMKKKNENKNVETGGTVATVAAAKPPLGSEVKVETKVEKELKNEMNSLKKDESLDTFSDEKLKKEETATSISNSKSKLERQSSKGSFLQSLEKKLEKLRTVEETRKSSSNGRISSEEKSKERTVRENSAPPIESLCAQSNAIKKAISVEDLTLSKKSPTNSTKSRVSSVLGLFRANDAKQNLTTTKSQSTIMSRLKKSPPKVAKAETPIGEDSSSSVSKIPMKSAKSDTKVARKAVENRESRKSLENVVTDSKKIVYKEKSKERETNTKEKRLSSERQLKELKGPTEKSLRTDKTSPSKEISNEKEKTKKKISPAKEEITVKAVATPDEPEIPKIPDNNAESNGPKVEKKITKTKKSITSSLKKVNSVAKGDETTENKPPKVTKSKESTQKEETDGTKKKRIVRVVKKVVRKSSDSSESKSDEKQKVLLKKSSSLKKETSPENRNECNDQQNSSKSRVTVETPKSSTEEAKSKMNLNHNKISTPDSDNVQTKSVEQRPNRGSLKLDLSKIPQHTFRNSTPKRDSPKSEVLQKPSIGTPTGSPKTMEITAENASDKLLDSLSKMTHHATITGNRIIIDKPLRAKDVLELKKEVNECARLIENQIELHANETLQTAAAAAAAAAAITTDLPNNTTHQEAQISDVKSQPEKKMKEKKEEVAPKKEEKEIHTERPELPNECEEKTKETNKNDSYQSINANNNYALTEEILSPADEGDSFDSWSICSADMNHTRVELNSPTSPSYSLFLRGDQGESVIDRIRRRSFYSRFNDRKRPSLTVPPPGVTLPGGSLPRKYSFGSSGERDRSKLNSYPTYNRRLAQRSFSLHNDDVLSYRKSPIERYSDIAGSSCCSSDHLRSPIEHYDPLRKYLRSPTMELSSARKRYHSTDFTTEKELAQSYRNASFNSMLNNNIADVYANRNSGTLPRKYGSTINCSEPKSVEYYEELLSPTNADYLTVRRSPMSNEYLNRCENGYHNGNVTKLQLNCDKSRTDKSMKVDFTEESEEDFGEETRRSTQCVSETRDLPSTSNTTRTAE